MKNFDELGLSAQILNTLDRLGYETATPVQSEAIPALLAGRDIVAQAETGTGKTAAFALPLLMGLDLASRHTQALVLAPTRELAIQVAEAIKSYAKGMDGFSIVPIYGGQSYDTQLKALKRGVQVVVGTPGRVMDHLRRKTLMLDQLKMLVLDEADEMLKMGFQQDVEWILEQANEDHQTALFSATIPGFIKKLTSTYLKDPVKVHIQANEKEVPSITQTYTMISGQNKLTALTRFLEIDPYDAAIIFVRTKTMSQELSDQLSARGYAVAPLNGDVKQSQREKVISQLKNGRLDIVVATDVAARGLDVSRIDLVVNYDTPHDTESYIHRIGRTGRAGRKGRALLLITPRERRMLGDIERATKQPITAVTPPSHDELAEKRVANFQQQIMDQLQKQELSEFREMIATLEKQAESSVLDIAAALASLLHPKGLASNEKEVSWSEGESEKSGSGRRKERGGFGGKRSSGGGFSSERRGRGDGERSGGRSERKSFGDRPSRGDGERGGERSERKPWGDRPARAEGERSGARLERRPYADRPARAEGERSERKSFGDRPSRGDGERSGNRSERKPFGDRPARADGERSGARSERKPFGDRPARADGERSGARSERKPFGDRPARDGGEFFARAGKGSKSSGSSERATSYDNTTRPVTKKKPSERFEKDSTERFGRVVKKKKEVGTGGRSGARTKPAAKRKAR